MELENRYIVIKMRDAAHILGPDDCQTLNRLMCEVNSGRALDGKKPLKGLFIESDWPEYEPTKAALLERINSASQEPA